MTQQVEYLLSEALKLSEGERVDLAAHLIESLDPGMDDDVETAWSVEIQKRLDEYRAGQVQPIPWPKARRLIMEDADDSSVES